MKPKLCYSTLLFFVLPLFSIMAQSPDLDQIVSVRYEGVRLEAALEEMSETYDLNFTYSKEFIPINQKVSVVTDEEPLSAALDELFAYTQVIYMVIGSQIALRIDENKDLSLLHELEEERRRERLASAEVITYNPAVSEEQSAPVLTTNFPTPTTTSTRTDTSTMVIAVPDTSSNYPIVLTTPPDRDDGDSKYTTLSDVIFSQEYDFSKGVSGFVNLRNQDIKGVQAGIFANVLDADIVGLQAAGLVNVNLGYTEGLQAAGVLNVAHETNALQIALAGNIVEGDFKGIQLSSFFNIVNGNSGGIQLTSGVNISTDEAVGQIGGVLNVAKKVNGFQFSGGINIAREVTGGQIGGLNIAREVEGFQIGFINIADTISGAPIGLINIIKKGYNRVEFTYQMHGLNTNLAIKLGAKSFYNILYLGAQIDTPNSQLLKDTQINAWGLGYGIGTSFQPKPSSRWRGNVELIAAHVIEDKAWDETFNLLTQTKLTIDFRIGKRWSIFAGPQLNMMFSERYDPETMQYGSGLAHTPFVEKTNEVTGETTQMWWGASAGLRF